MTLVKCRYCFRCYDANVDTVMIICDGCQEAAYDRERDIEIANKILKEANQYGN